MKTLYFGFECATIFISLCAILYLSIEKKLPRYEQRRVFLALLIDVFVCSVLSFVFQLVFHYLTLPLYALRMTLMSVYFLAHIALPPLFFHYTVLMDGSLYKMKRKYRAFIYIPLIVPLTLLLINGFHPFLFDVGENVQIVRIDLYPYLITGLIYLLFSIFDFAFHYKHLLKRTRISYLASLGVYLLGLILQMIYSEMRIELLAAISALLILETLYECDGAQFSPTTGLLSKAAFLNRIDQFFAAKFPFEILSVRLTRFDSSLSSLGLEKSKALEKRMGEELLDAHRSPSVLVFHVETDRFIFLILDHFEESEKAILDRLEKTVISPSLFLGCSLPLDCMVMKLSIPKDVSSLKELTDILHNERALPLRKKMTILPQSGVEELKMDLKILAAVKKKIETHQIQVYYQPIYSVQSHSIVAAEALLRLNDEKLGYLRPDKVVYLAEHNGLISALDQAVLEEVCSFLERKRPERYGIEYIEVNLSLYEMLSPHLTEQYLSILRRHHISPSRINLEFLETSTSDFPVFENQTKSLKEAGFLLSLDDFGTEYSNMDRLFSNDFVTIKVDKDLLWSAFKDENAKNLLSSLLSMLRKMGLNTLQEGVENKEQLDYVTSQGANYIQGFYFSKAIKEEDFLTYLQNFKEKA